MAEQHDIVSISEGLGAKLSSRSRHVCAFLGAGTSKACGLPDVAALQRLVVEGLDAHQRPLMEALLTGRDLEQALSRVRRIAALLADVAGEVGDLDGAAAAALDTAVCEQIVKHLDHESADLRPVLHFATWAAQCDYATPLEVFTVNYDLLLETALERLAVPYFDGFVGALHARFRAELVEAEPRDAHDWLPTFLVRLWKLHGSINWEWEGVDNPEVLRRGAPLVSGEPAAIYPSDAKYDESRRVPFVVLQDRFRRALRVPESIVLVAGYSWADEHLNEMLFDAARNRPRTEVVSFSYSAIPDLLRERAEEIPNILAIGAEEAVVGGLRAAWTGPNHEIADVWVAGQAVLGNFSHLARFLARSSSPSSDTDRRLLDALAKLITPGV